MKYFMAQRRKSAASAEYSSPLSSLLFPHKHDQRGIIAPFSSDHFSTIGKFVLDIFAITRFAQDFDEAELVDACVDAYAHHYSEDYAAIAD